MGGNREVDDKGAIIQRDEPKERERDARQSGFSCTVDETQSERQMALMACKCRVWGVEG